ncbi:MAG TPA: sulfur carrier protein ThiS adenylyltransferase ThiF [Firmicutes bacterium]|nr:sulfur carrier protein ThiS adenylyltransferase ThiF [Bacillota bacterium]
MIVTVNEIRQEISEGKTLFQLRKEMAPEADIMILNSCPTEEDFPLREGDIIVFIQRGRHYEGNELNALLAARHSPGVHEKVGRAVVGIAGLGGLGSNAAVALARMGVGTLILADFDVVEPSNINRQHYFLNHIGRFKTEAMKEIIAAVHPGVDVRLHTLRLTRENIPGVFRGASVIIEALDKASEKAAMIETVLKEMKESYVISGSGMAGYGPSNAIETVQLGRLIICGDQMSEAGQDMGLMAPRVGICAHHQANAALRLILGLDQA